MFTSSLALALLVLLWYVTALFIVALIRGNNNILDVGWAPGFLFVAYAVLWWWAAPGARPILAIMLVTIWAVRLWVHTFLRNWNRGESRHHSQLRAGKGYFWPLYNYFRIFVLKGSFIVLISLPVLWIATYGGPPLGWLDIAGVALWLAGFSIETVADAQLTVFLKNPRNHGRRLNDGLWSFGDHPNYFGEILQWWGLWLMASSVSGGWITILGPIVVMLMMLQVAIPRHHS